MRVLQILPEMNVGGVETGTVDFAKYLVGHGHGSIVISNGGKLVKDLNDSGTKHYVLPVHKKSIINAFKMVRKVRAIIKKERVDIVHARSRVPAWIAYFACRKTDAAFITTCHGYYKNRFFSQVMGFSKLVIVPSKVIARHMIDDFKVSASAIRCIPRSVDTSRFKNVKQRERGKSSATVAIVGRITQLKGHVYFLKSMAKVARSMPYIKIWIIGDAPKNKLGYKQDLEILVERLGLKKNVEFLGNRSDVPDLLAQVDCLVLSTVTQESFGRVILEAQVSGVPVVATKVGGVVDIIDDEKTGLLVMPKDIDAMAKAVTRLLNDKKLSDQFVEAAQKKIQENYLLEHMASGTLKVYEEILSSMNILVFKISSIGDVVLVIPSLKALRKRYPKAHIYCLVGKEAMKVLQNCPYVDGLIVCDFKHKDKGLFKFFKLARKLRKYRFDKTFDFQNNLKSHALSFLSFPEKNYGFHNGKGSFLLMNKLKKYENDIPAVDHQFQLLKFANVDIPENPELELWPGQKDEDYVQELLDSEWLGNAKNIIGINISASPKWKTKNWPIENLAKFCDLVSSKNWRVIITGSEHDRPLVNHLLTLTKSKPANLAGKTDIMQLACLIRRCSLFITPDSAPMHIAAAMKTPFIVFFGPTDSARHVPPAQNMKVIEKKLKCRPCYSQRCNIFTHACMKEISPEEVFVEVEALLRNEKKRGKEGIDF